MGEASNPIPREVRFAGRGGDPEERLSAPSLEKGGCPWRDTPVLKDFAFSCNQILDARLADPDPGEEDGLAINLRSNGSPSLTLKIHCYSDKMACERAFLITSFPLNNFSTYDRSPENPRYRP